MWSVQGRGFLPRETASELLPSVFEAHEDLVRNIGALHAEGCLREAIKVLPLVSLFFGNGESEDRWDRVEGDGIRLNWERDVNAAFTLYGILASAYVFGGEPPNDGATLVLPECVASPLKRISHHLGRLPILDYAGIVLSNWKLTDPQRPVSLENVEVLRTFTGLRPESWFYKIHVVIEEFGAQAILNIDQALEASEASTVGKAEPSVMDFIGAASNVSRHMKRIAASLAMINETLGRMPEGCSDDDFYNVIRPWLGGWSQQGIVYENTSTYPQAERYGGGSGAQSSLLPCIDAFLGISYGKAGPGDCPGLQKFVEQLMNYRLHMPPEHREKIAELEATGSIRPFIEKCSRLEQELTESYIGSIENPQDVVDYPMIVQERTRMLVSRLHALNFAMKQDYNECIEHLIAFRRRHVGFATMYITRQAKLAAMKTATPSQGEEIVKAAETGTGGSTFAKHLMHHINDTRKATYPVDGPSGMASSIPSQLEQRYVDKMDENAVPLGARQYEWFENEAYARARDAESGTGIIENVAERIERFIAAFWSS